MLPIFFDLTYEIITPLYMSGTDAKQPELRASSIRGAVRSWYRALDPQFLDHESSTFGAAFDDGEEERVAGTQQSPFRLQVLKPPPEDHFELTKDRFKKRFDRGNPPNRTNGILYTGYTLLDNFNARRAFDASNERKKRAFTLRLLFVRPDVTPTGLARLHRILASFWALGHLGALGSRANRGWGSVQLTETTLGPRSATDPRLRHLLERYQPARPSDARSWGGEVAGFLADFADLAGRRSRSGHARATPHIGRGARVLVDKKPSSGWEHALNKIGAEFQAFRREQGAADRQAVVQELLRHQRRGGSGQPLLHAPQRTAFGLPFTMRYGITPGWVQAQGTRKLRPDTIEFNPGDRSQRDSPPRHASSLRLRVVRLGSGYHPVVVRLAGDPVGAEPRSPDNPDTTPAVLIGGRVGETSQTVGPHDRPSDALLDAFVNRVSAHSLNLPVPE